MPAAENDWWWAVDNIAVSGQGGSPVNPPVEFDLLVETFNLTLTPEIQWTVSLNAVDYEVLLANDAGFSDVVLSAVTSDLSFSPEPGSLLPGSYYVRVIARNDIGTAETTGRIGLGMPDPLDLDGNSSRDIFDLIRFENEFSN